MSVLQGHPCSKKAPWTYPRILSCRLLCAPKPVLVDLTPIDWIIELFILLQK